MSVSDHREASGTARLVGAGSTDSLSGEYGAHEVQIYQPPMPLSLPPLPLVLFLGVLVTPTVVVGFLKLQSVWLTYASLYYLWVVAPCAVCFFWSRARHICFARWRRAMRSARLQLLLAVPVVAAVVGSSLLGAHLLAVPVLGLDVAAIRARLAGYGLTPTNPAGDLGALAWLTALNPLMEEGFWRLFLFQMLLARCASEAQEGLPVGDDGGEEEEQQQQQQQQQASTSRRGGRDGGSDGGRSGGGGGGVDGAAVVRTAAASSSSSSSSSSSGPAWWCACLVTSALYASYHVPIVISFLPLPLVAAAYVGLVGLGVALQLIVERWGMLLAILVHAAYDLTASLLIADVLFRWGILAA